MAEARTDIVSCLSHVERLNLQGTTIESHVTAHLLATVCAAFESEFQRLALARIGAQADQHVAAFLKTAVERTWRGLRMSDIAGFLAHFDEGVKGAFQRDLLGDPGAIAFSNIVTARHRSSHGESFEMTLRELLDSYDKSGRVLEVAFNALTSAGQVPPLDQSASASEG